MTDYTNKSRRLARETYWQVHDRDTYECPDCGRSEGQLQGTFEVHHKNGEPLDNRLENRVALCRACHMLREDKKPSLAAIKQLRDQYTAATEPSLPDSVRVYCEEIPPIGSECRPWVDPLAVWMSFYQDWCDDAGYEPAAPDSLVSGLREHCDAVIEWKDGGIVITGPDPTSRGWEPTPQENRQATEER
jgi:5-methylcytosine-specific restriction endonuclease McrA